MKWRIESGVKSEQTKTFRRFIHRYTSVGGKADYRDVDMLLLHYTIMTSCVLHV